MGFDAKALLSGGGGISDIAASFGVPSCMLDLASDLNILGLIPSPILFAMREAMRKGRELADNIVKKINQIIRDELGISLFPDRDGFFGFFSESSRLGLDILSGITGALGAFIGLAQGLAGIASEIERRYAEIEACLQKFKDFLDNSNAGASERREQFANLDPAGFDEYISQNFGVFIDQANAATEARDNFDNAINNIDGIIDARASDPSLEPGAEDDEVVESVFRLEFGPPKSRDGKFVLSVDGLYYDSQASGIQPALLELAEREEDVKFREGGFPDGNLWKLEFDPSLGGRGIPMSSKDLRFYFNTLLDPEILDNSPSLSRFYDQDELLLTLEGQKDRKVFDVSADIQDLVDSAASIAVIDNMKQVMLSEASHFQDKINKRKKQIELAVKVPILLGKGALYAVGEVPVNDFSYLAGTNFLIDIEEQRKIVLNQADVEGVVLPLEIKFTEKITSTDSVFLDHILLSNVAKGEIIDDAASSSAPSIQINTRIVEDELFALYNYLTVETDVASGFNFGVRNSSQFGQSYNSQIVGDSSSIFDKGLGIPFLSGVAHLDSNLDLSGNGTYIKLPQKSKFQDFLYNSKGATFETWVHTPNLKDVDAGYTNNNASGLYRLILANENVGISDSKQPQSNINNMSFDGGTGIVRGAILGFTRDRRFTSGLDPSNDASENGIAGLQLVLAPTQSYDSSSAGFIANRENCNRNSWYGMTVPVFQKFNNKTLSSCNDEFSQISVSIDPEANQVKVYLDGVNLATSSYQDTFGTDRVRETYKAPSIYQNNSFEYSGGPSLDSYFTPWIIGGGYTDGIDGSINGSTPDGNFMGGRFGGQISGLRGYIGCTRFYSKALSESEVLNNYNATQKFFKNIDLS
tara:strand:+ start:3976 stop:6576 length:2601 start_codon:yes stop_codon:yes gene_type:complete